MYEIKGKINEDENVHYVYEFAADVLEAERIALADGVYEIHAAHLSRIKEAYHGEGEWYKATLSEVFVDPDNGKEKRANYQVLIQSPDFFTASAKLADICKQGYQMTVKSLDVTGITDVITATASALDNEQQEETIAE